MSEFFGDKFRENLTCRVNAERHERTFKDIMEQVARYLTIHDDVAYIDIVPQRLANKLAQSQNVQPMTDARALFGTWLYENDDGFEQSIKDLQGKWIE